jgi:hypothetical protein
MLRISRMNIRALARDQECEIRLPGVCNFDIKTTVLAHFRLSNLSGMGLKSIDIFAAFSCSSCHSYCDTHHDDATQCSHLRGVIRTQARLVEMGVLQVKGERERKAKPLSKILPRRNVV